MKKLFTILFILTTAVCFGQLNINQRQVLKLRDTLDAIHTRIDGINGGNPFDSLQMISGVRYGIVADGVTDNTTAFAALISAAVSAQSAIISLPKGIILVDTVAIPGSSSWLNIEIRGTQSPSFLWGTVGTASLPTSGTIIKTSRTAATGTLFQQKANSGSFSSIHLILRNLEFRASDNPFVNGVDAHWCSQFEMYNCFINTGVYNVQAVQPTHSTFGLRTPKIDNGAETILDNVLVTGYSKGIIVQEHTNGNNISIGSCYYGLSFETYQGHPTNFGRVLVQRCKYPISIGQSAQPSWLRINQLAIEKADSATQTTAPTEWQITWADILDHLSYGRGDIQFTSTTGNVGLNYTVTKDGGLFLRTQNLERSIENISGLGAYMGFNGYDNIAGTSTATPPFLSFMGSYANSVTGTKMKIKLYDDGTAANNYGFGNSAGQLNYFVPNTATHNFYVNDIEKFRINGSGILFRDAVLPTSGSGGTDSALFRNSSTGQTYLAPAGVTGVLPIANGGTNNASLSVTDQNLIISDGTKLIGLPKGANGQHLIVNGSGNLSFVDSATGGGSLNLSYNSGTHAIDISGGGTSAVIPLAISSANGLATTNQIIGTIGTSVDGQGGVVSTGSKGFITVPYNATITNWYVSADVSGSIQFDIKRSGTSIVGGGGNKPLLSTAISGNAAAASWTSVTVTAGDILEWVVDSATTITNCTVVLKVIK